MVSVLPVSSRNKISLVVVTFLVVTSFFALVNVYSVLHYRVSLAFDRGPVYSEETGAQFLYRIDDTFIDGAFVGIVYFEPLYEDSPVPYGLDRWLDAGTVAISPALQNSSDFVERQFGHIEQIISPKALISPDERLVFVRPTREQSEKWQDLARRDAGVYFASSFGTSSAGVPYGVVTYENWASYLLPLVFVSLLPPLIIFLAVTRKTLRVSLRSSVRILMLIGSTKRVLRTYCAKACVPWLALGFLFAFFFQGVVFIQGYTIPWVDFTVTAVMLKDAVLPTLLGDCVLVFLLTWYFTTPDIRVVRRKKSVNVPQSVSMVMFALGIVAISIVGIAGIWLPDDLYLPLIAAGLLLISLGIFGAFATLFQAFAYLYNRVKSVSISTPFMRWVENNPQRSSRNAALAGMSIVVGMVLVSFYAIVNQSTHVNIANDDSVYVSQTKFSCYGVHECQQSVEEKLGSVVPQAAYVGYIEVENGTVVFSSLPLALKENTYIQSFIKEIEHEYGSDTSMVSGEAIRGTVFSFSTTPIDNELQKIRFGAFIPLTESYGASAIAIATIYQEHARWFLFFIYISFLLFLLAFSQGTSQKIEEETREFAVMSVITGHNKQLSFSLAQRSIILSVWGMVAGIILGFYVAIQIGTFDFLPHAYGFIALITVSLGVMGIIEAYGYYRSLRHAEWKSGRNVGVL